MISFRELTKRFGAHEAVSSLTFDVRPGEIYALLGPNGAGKTTALRCLATLMRPSSGTVVVGDADVMSDPRGVRRRVGFLSTSMGLYERLTAREQIEYFGRLQELDGTVLIHRVEELIDRFGIGPFADRYCGRLSTGQRQRVAIARAVVQDPEALVLDEPTNGLDVVSGQGIYAFMQESRSRGKAILFATHNLAEVELLADRVGILDGGRLVAEGTVSGLLEYTGTPNLTRAFLSLVRH